jgi:gas vesicle protein
MGDTTAMESVRSLIEGFGSTCETTIKKRKTYTAAEIKILEKELDDSANNLRQTVNEEINKTVAVAKSYKPPPGTPEDDPTHANYAEALQRESDSMNKTTNWVQKIFTKIKNAIKSIIQKVKDAISDLFEFIKNEFKTIRGEPI